MVFTSNNASQKLKNQDAAHRQAMERVGNYRHVKRGDADFERMAAEIMAGAPASKHVEKTEIVKTRSKRTSKAQQKTKRRSTVANPVKPCAKCGAEVEIVDRGLCGPCYYRENISGTLDENYPAEQHAQKEEKGPSVEQRAETQPTTEPASQEQKPDQQANPAFVQQLDTVLASVRQMLIDKNKAYGNSALEPVRIFSNASPVEQICVRIDDKLSRLMRGHEFQGDDTGRDLLGYLVLLEVAKSEREGTV